MPLTFLPGSSRPTMPEVIERDGVTYDRREIAARNVREGDLIGYYDCTGKPGTVGTASVGVVWFAESTPAGRGRRYVAPWRRRVFTVRDWRGVPNVPANRDWQHPHNGTLYFEQLDRVEIWRAR